ncbi:MAG: riboflavin biosynthesis protein RibF, partial [Bacillota bacterium]
MKCHEGLNGLSEPDAAGGRTVVIGAFDGVHLGHRRLILTAREGAGEDGAELAVLTFWPPPQLVLSPGQWAGLLCSREHKTRLIGDLGV